MIKYFDLYFKYYYYNYYSSHHLLELQRYFNAASEAAQEVIQEQGEDCILNVDLTKLANLGLRPLDSPGRIIASQLANGNPLFRYVKYISNNILLFEYTVFK